MLALRRSGTDYEIQPAAETMPQVRCLRLLAEGNGLDVAWSVATGERDRQLRPIRIPIDRGLIGWRVLLIHSGDTRFASVTSLRDLAEFIGVQGHDWPDFALLRSNGLNIASGYDYEGMFQMLARQHVDYFPRALSEVGEELRSHSDSPIQLERHLLLHYPSALYFFVNRDNETLAADIEHGLEASIRDGSLVALFDATYRDSIRMANLPGRLRIELDTGNLGAELPLERSELWFRPSP